jgi:predicted amidohydrolase
MKIALGQFGVSSNKGGNVAHMLAMIAEASAAGAALIVFPEVAMVNIDERDRVSDVAEPIDGPFVDQLAQAARRSNVAVVAGFLESIPGSDKAYNSAVAIAADGLVIGTYRKIHMFDAFGKRESSRNMPGNGDTLIFQLADVKFGVAICYDLRFPELFRHFAEQGVDVALIPAAWATGLLKEHHWNTLICARAIENTIYVAAAAQVGGANCGSSKIVDPMGVVIAALGETEGLVVGDVDVSRIAAVREKLPSLQHIRHDLYRRWQLVVDQLE